MNSGADFVKTSTGFSTGGATIEDIELMREAVGPTMGVKASGGARTLEAAQAFYQSWCNPYWYFVRSGHNERARKS